MGVRIKSTGISRDTDTFSIVERSGRAAVRAMAAAGVEPGQVGLLINTGIFRDNNTVEPAVSALIQKAAGIGLDYVKEDPRSFSFDLMNAGAGVLAAVQVAQAVLATGSAEHVLIVSGDTHPSMARSTADDEFPYATAGAALLLEQTDDPEGFGRVHTRAGGGTPGLESYVDVETMGTRGRGLMTVEREAGYVDRLLAVAADAARAALAGSDTDAATTALIAATPAPDFPARLATELGLAAEAVFTPDLSEGDPHTASLTLAYDAAAQADSLRDYTHVLFVSAGAGPTAAAVVYRLPAAVGATA